MPQRLMASNAVGWSSLGYGRRHRRLTRESRLRPVADCGRHEVGGPRRIALRRRGNYTSPSLPCTAAADAAFNVVVTAEFFFQSLRRYAAIVGGFQWHA
jgi:hypothetical protein